MRESIIIYNKCYKSYNCDYFIDCKNLSDEIRKCNIKKYKSEILQFIQLNIIINSKNTYGKHKGKKIGKNIVKQIFNTILYSNDISPKKKIEILDLLKDVISAN